MRQSRQRTILRSRSLQDDLRAEAVCTFCGRKPKDPGELIGMYFPTICRRCVRKGLRVVTQPSEGEKLMCLFCGQSRGTVFVTGSAVVCNLCLMFCQQLIAGSD